MPGTLVRWQFSQNLLENEPRKPILNRSFELNIQLCRKSSGQLNAHYKK